MGPRLRRAVHECVDILFDAIEEDAKGTPVRKPRGKRVHEMPTNITEERLAKAREVAKRLGWTG